MLYNARKTAIDFFNNFTSRAFEDRHKAKQEPGFKILTPKQMTKTKSKTTNGSCTNKSRQ